MNYTREYAVYTPTLKSGEGWPVKVNPSLGNFTYGFDDSVLAAFGLRAVSFCFFILWDEGPGLSGSLNSEVWIKKELSIRGPGQINLNDRSCFDQKFFADEPLSEVVSKEEFFRAHGLHLSYIVIRDLKGDFALREDQKVAVLLRYDPSTGTLTKDPVALKQLQEMLVQHSNKKMKINKPLHYYETDLEKYLQTTCKDTGALFPGDCDMLLYDQNNLCRCILEFKKTTQRDAASLEEQSFLRHMDRDRSKYTRLNILRTALAEREGRPIPFATVFYSVKAGENTIKIERIGPSLQLEGDCTFAIGPNLLENQRLILQKTMEICS
ncbi:hypothetical protein [Bittarella massiliensis (ex Durand et al. 2017)]|uniref:hypothetical protein n=1 Tax=Bittarella massiliensis (ex Durand et al. 2017) TaxID=1720313 RepID=UPI001AA15EF6|nr:hypothetical protein [Bittarella massiliensis (ex Durand et al. 2017)]MBO1679738.1 hypothetical protein [Bittarella massiliensis (ex Durand et al. 2017)]